MFRADKGKLNPSYLYFFLLTDSVFRRVQSLQKGGTYPAINDSELLQQVIPHPSLAEQQTIASILFAVDNAISDTDRLIQKNSRIKQGLMQDLFQFGVDNHYHFRSEHTHCFNDTPIGRVPEEWGIRPLGDLLTKIIDFRGKTPKKLGMNWGGGTIPALSAKNVDMGNINLARETNFGSEQLYKKWMRKGKCTKGDIVLTMEAPLGNVAQIPDYGKYILSQRVVLLQARDCMENNYLKYALMDNRFQRSLVMNSTGSTATGIQQKKLLRIQLPVPLKNEQERIASILSATDQAIESNQTYKKKLISVKWGLMQDLLTGRVCVNDFMSEDHYAENYRQGKIAE